MATEDHLSILFLITYPPLIIKKGIRRRRRRENFGVEALILIDFLSKIDDLMQNRENFRAAGASSTRRPNMVPLPKEKYFKLAKIDF